MSSKTLPPRSKVKKEDTWDLTQLYKSNAAWEKDLKRLEKKVDGYEQFKGRLKEGPKTIRACYDFDTAFGKLLEKVYRYASLKRSEDISNSAHQGMFSRLMFVYTRGREASSFIAPELQALPAATLKNYIASPTLKPYRIVLKRLARMKLHILSQKEERLLAMQGEISGSARETFSQLTNADFKFGTVKDEAGNTVELTHGSLPIFLKSPKRSVRKRAYLQFSEEYEKHQNTLAATMRANVLQNVYQARARNYPSAREASLFEHNIPVGVYDNLIDTVHAHLPSFHRYYELRRKKLKLREIFLYDSFNPLGEIPKTRIPYIKACDMIRDASAPLGTAYVSVMDKGLRGSWVDRYENEGKTSGAFSSPGFEGPPYILMNYKPELVSSVFTLAHEAGHSMHSYYSARSQPFQHWRYTTFVAEVASMFNEQLLAHHLLQKARTKAQKLELVCLEIDKIRGSIGRQAMFAEWEKIIHAIAESGEPLTVERFRSEYRKLFQLHFGPNFAFETCQELEGLRIPHFYMGFYVFQYATGFSAAIALSQMVLNGGTKERDRYLRFLKSGGSDWPLDQLRSAGVDMESPEPVDIALNRFAELLDELEALL